MKKNDDEIKNISELEDIKSKKEKELENIMKKSVEKNIVALRELAKK